MIGGLGVVYVLWRWFKDARAARALRDHLRAAGWNIEHVECRNGKYLLRVGFNPHATFWEDFFREYERPLRERVEQKQREFGDFYRYVMEHFPVPDEAIR